MAKRIGNVKVVYDDEDESIKEVQRFLKSQGAVDLQVTGVFDIATLEAVLEAVMKYQQNKHIQETGQFDIGMIDLHNSRSKKDTPKTKQERICFYGTNYLTVAVTNCTSHCGYCTTHLNKQSPFPYGLGLFYFTENRVDGRQTLPCAVSTIKQSPHLFLAKLSLSNAKLCAQAGGNPNLHP